MKIAGILRWRRDFVLYTDGEYGDVTPLWVGRARFTRFIGLSRFKTKRLCARVVVLCAWP